MTGYGNNAEPRRRANALAAFELGVKKEKTGREEVDRNQALGDENERKKEKIVKVVRRRRGRKEETFDNAAK